MTGSCAAFLGRFLSMVWRLVVEELDAVPCSGVVAVCGVSSPSFPAIRWKAGLYEQGQG